MAARAAATGAATMAAGLRIPALRAATGWGGHPAQLTSQVPSVWGRRSTARAAARVVGWAPVMVTVAVTSRRRPGPGPAEG